MGSPLRRRERALITLDSIGDAVICTDLKGKIIFLNMAAEKMTGWSSEEAIHQTMSKTFMVIEGNTHISRAG